VPATAGRQVLVSADIKGQSIHLMELAMAWRNARGLKMLFSKCSAGAGFEILLELERFVIVFKTYRDNNVPRRMFFSMSTFRAVMVF
jgi:hypothetical protein